MCKRFFSVEEESQMVMRRVTNLVGLCLLFASIVAAQTAKLQGVWEGTRENEGRQQLLTFDLQVKGTVVSGKVSLDGDEFGSFNDGRIEGNKVSFKIGGASFDGTLEGEQLKITVVTGSGKSFQVVASRKKARS
jgi:hypothetical protein